VRDKVGRGQDGRVYHDFIRKIKKGEGKWWFYGRGATRSIPITVWGGFFL